MRPPLATPMAKVSNILCNTKEFEKAKPAFQDALRNSGHPTNLSYKLTQQQRNPKKSRSRNVEWFNPPFSQHVRTNIGKEFLRLINKHFGNPNHKLWKICNRSNLKISCSCIPNMKSIISNHNKRILEENVATAEKPRCYGFVFNLRLLCIEFVTRDLVQTRRYSSTVSSFNKLSVADVVRNSFVMESNN